MVKVVSIPSLARRSVRTEAAGAIIRSSPGVASEKLLFVPAKTQSGMLTGRFSEVSGKLWIELTGAGKTGWGMRENFAFVEEPTKADVQRQLSDMIETDKKTYKNGLYIAAKIDMLKRMGKDTSALEKRAKVLFFDYFARQKAIHEKSSWFSVQNWAAEGIKKVKDFFGLSGLGEPITIGTSALILTAVALVAGAVVMYFLMQHHNKSKTNYDETEEIKSILDKYDVSPEDRQQLGTEIQKQLDTSADKAAAAAANDSMWANAKNLILVVGVIGVTVKVIEWSQSKAPRVAA